MQPVLRVIALGLALVAASYGLAGEITTPSEGLRISGLAFGDAYGLVSSHDPALEGENGFWFRRIYLTFDHDLGDRLSTRLRFEAGHPGDFTSGDRLDPFVKDAYLNRKGARSDLRFGLSPTPTFEMIEKIWGYRALEKTLLDLQRLGSTRDVGIHYSGRSRGDRVGYRAMLGNGSSVGAETNEGKKGMLAVDFAPTERVTVEVYADGENRPGDTDRTTLSVWGGYRGEGWRAALQAVNQDREGERDIFAASGFVILELLDDLSLIGRIDRVFDPNPQANTIAYLPFDETARSTLLILAADFRVHDKLSLIPNVEAVFYDAPGGGVDPDDDVMLRLTFFYKN